MIYIYEDEQRKEACGQRREQFRPALGPFFSSHFAIYYFTVKDLIHDGDGEDNNDKLNTISPNLGEVKGDKASLQKEMRRNEGNHSL